MCHNGIYHTRCTCRILLLVHIGFAKRAGDKTVFGICNGLLAIFVYCIAQALHFTVTDFNNILPIGKLLYGLLQILVILQQLNSKKARGVFIPYILVDTDYAFHLFNAPLQFRPVIDMDVAVKACRMLLLLLMSAEVMVGYILLVPVAQIIQDFGTYLTFFIQKITTLVNADDNMEKLFYAFSGATDGRQHRHAKQLTELYVIQRVPACFQFVVHVKRDNHAHVHVNQLGGEIQVPFQIGRVHHINNDIRSFVDDVMAHINLFGRIGRKRISARQVNDAEMIPLKVKIPLFSIYGDTAVITHMLVRTRGDVEKGCLAAIGITHQSDIDGAAFSQSDTFQFLFVQTHIFAPSLVIVELHGLPTHFLFTDNLNHLSFLTP